jgi:hypothetical protein
VAARGEALPVAGEQSRGGTCATKKKRGEEVRGTCLKNFQKVQGSLGKLRFLTDI